MKRWIHASEEIDEEFDEWDPFHGKTYLIIGGYDSKTENDPAKAITQWYRYQVTNPTDCSISCKKLDDAIALCKAATPDLINALSEKYKCPYKAQYMINEAAKKVADGCKYFHEGEYGDSVHPFGVG